MEKELRMIRAKNRKNEKEYIFVTNIIEELNAADITRVYKKRWDIEIFFRYIKQEFWFNHLVSRNLNGILVMLYMTLIAALLILIYDIKNEIWSFKIAKLRFTLELDVLLAKDVWKWLNWDIWDTSTFGNLLKSWP